MATKYAPVLRQGWMWRSIRAARESNALRVAAAGTSSQCREYCAGYEALGNGGAGETSPILGHLLAFAGGFGTSAWYYSQSDKAIGSTKNIKKKERNISSRSEQGGPIEQVWFGFNVCPKEGIRTMYQLGEQLGEGNFGKTFAARDLLQNRDVAVKILPKATISCADSIEDVDREVEIMRHLSGHENVVEFYDALEDEEFVYIAMELCEGGELFDAVQENKGKYSEKEAADTIRQILKVIAHCHLNGIVYCDVKPENFLYLSRDHKVLKAIDFGLSRHFTPLGRALRKPRGTAYYVAPEVMRFEYGPEADIWSVGVIAYLLLSGTVPFYGDTEKEILKQVIAGREIDFESGPWKKISPQAKDLVKKLLERDVGQRYSAVQALTHPWLRGEASGAAVIDAAAVSSLHAFSKYGRMRKLALRAVAAFIADSKMIEDLRLQFKAMDKQNNNRISVKELQEALKSTTWKHTDKDMQNLLESIHCYTYGPFRHQSTGATIDYHEFLAATMSMKQLEQQIEDKEHWADILRKAFTFFDKDGDGLISCDDLRKCLSSDRDADVDKLVLECMKEANISNTGNITYDEFVQLLHIHDPASASRYGYVKTPEKK